MSCQGFSGELCLHFNTACDKSDTVSDCDENYPQPSSWLLACVFSLFQRAHPEHSLTISRHPRTIRTLNIFSKKKVLVEHATQKRESDKIRVKLL